MPTDKEVLNGVLSTLFKMDETEIASLYEDETEVKADALQTILDKDAERIKGLKPDTKKYFDDGHKKGLSDALSKFEKEAKAKYGLQSEKQGLDLLDDLVAQFKVDNPDDPEKIKKSKFYLDAVEGFAKELKAKEDELTGKYEAFIKQAERKELFGNVSERALVLLENLKPILPADAEKAAMWKKTFLNELAALNYTQREGDIVLLDPEGNDMVDRHQHRIKFDDHVRGIAEKYFEFHVSDPKNAPPHNPKNPKSTVFIINSEADFTRLMNEVKTPEEKTALLNAYNEARAAGRIK